MLSCCPLLIDLVFFWFLTVTITLLLIIHPGTIWALLLIRLVTPLPLVFEKQWLNWFEISKLLAAVAGILIMNYIQWFEPDSLRSRWIISWLLCVNMLEAVVRDLQSGILHVPNAFAGAGLLYLVSFEASAKIECSMTSAMMLFPLPLSWVLLYMSWNAAFSYGYNFSPSTRAMLVTPLLVSYVILRCPSAWLGARVMSMTLNMMFRALRFTKLYQPGLSYLTPLHYQHNWLLLLFWGLFNVILVVILLASL
jgi:hypothetical protein